MSPPKILVVDDHVDMVRTMCRLLENIECKPTGARNAAEALVCARKTRFDVLIADIAMPGMCGRELLSEIRFLYPIAAIAVSGFDGPEDIATDLAAGFTMRLTKPVGIEDIWGAVHLVLEPRGGLSAPPRCAPRHAST